MIGITGVDDLIRLVEGYERTSTIENLKPHSVTFAKDEAWLKHLITQPDADCYTLLPVPLGTVEIPNDVALKIRPIFVNDPVTMFILFHNRVNAQIPPAKNQIDDSAKIHSSAVIGVEGIRYIQTSNKIVQMKHMGNVVIGEDVEIGPFATVHRSTIDSTIIEDDVKIGSYCNVGHNVTICKETILTVRVTIGGSAYIGPNCFFGMHSVVRDNVKICAGVQAGMGAVISKDITEPGKYVGLPARRIGDWDMKW